VADRYTSQMALVLDAPVEDVTPIVKAAGAAGDIDRGAPVRGQAEQAHEVHWGGRMQKAVVRATEDERDGAPILRTETYIGSDGLVHGMKRQAQLLQALARQLRGRVQGVRDLSGVADRDEAWMHRLAIGAVEVEDAITFVSEGEGTYWVRTHGAARFDIPDLELYGLPKVKVAPAEPVLRRVQDQLLRGGLKAELSLTRRHPRLPRPGPRRLAARPARLARRRPRRQGARPAPHRSAREPLGAPQATVRPVPDRPQGRRRPDRGCGRLTALLPLGAGRVW
jgi:hypothetical protein